MRVNPLTCGVDALRQVLLAGASGVSGFSALAGSPILARFDLLTDVLVLTAVARLLAGVAAFSLSRTD